MVTKKKRARKSLQTDPRPSKQRQNVILVLIASLLIVAAIIYSWGQAVQAERVEAHRTTKEIVA